MKRRGPGGRLRAPAALSGAQRQGSSGLVLGGAGRPSNLTVLPVTHQADNLEPSAQQRQGAAGTGLKEVTAMLERMKGLCSEARLRQLCLFRLVAFHCLKGIDEHSEEGL